MKKSEIIEILKAMSKNTYELSKLCDSKYQEAKLFSEYSGLQKAIFMLTDNEFAEKMKEIYIERGE